MLNKEAIPKHVAVIMDGNGRWAKQRMMPRVLGHNAGMNALVEIVRRASDIGVEYLTVYAFSTENWKRSQEEINGIFGLLVTFVNKKIAELCKENVCVKVFGDYHMLPESSVKQMNRLIEETKGNTGLQFNICLNYGGRDEILRSVKRIASQVKEGSLDVSEITEELIGEYLYSGDTNTPDPELLIRTSGEERLSNFLLWQVAYSEMVFVDTLWPDFTPEEFEKAIEEYQHRNRRFGGR